MPNNCAPAETCNAKSKTDCHMEQKFIVIGMDDRPQPYFPPEVQELIRCGKVFRVAYATAKSCRPCCPTVPDG